jgi:hypothetical protein
MAHLVELGGGRDLVQRIASERNTARIGELVDMPELVAWLEASGLTAGEAARIQPSYCGPPAHNCLCGTAEVNGFVQGTLGDSGSTLLVTAVYGPVTGVAPGDALILRDSRGVGIGHDSLFASISGDGAASVEFGATGGEVSLPLSACWFPQVASIPGPLPLAVVEQALLSAGTAACEAVLATHDPAWAKMQGGPECLGGTGGSPGVARDAGTRAQAKDPDDGGCSIALHGSGATPVICLAVSAAWILRRRLRMEVR